MTSGGPTLSELSGDQRAAWAAVRARLGSTHRWLVPALYRTVPVAVDPADAPASADRWGRVYLDFSVEGRRGLPALADAARDAILTWLAAETVPAPWHAPRLDERFPAVGAADTDRAARSVAAGLASTPRPAWGEDELDRWRHWARRVAGPPQIPWQDRLGGALRSALAAQAGHQVRTYTRPARRQQPGVVTAALRGPRLRVGIVADISGSLAPELPTVVAEVARISEAAGTAAGDVTLLAVDDEVAARYSPPPAGLVLQSRVGHLTDLRPGLAEATAVPHATDVVVVLTDGLTPWPDPAPPVPVIVALIGPRTVLDKAEPAAPTWATTVRIVTETS